LGVANVLYLNIRDRGAEIATLRAVGWREADLARLVVTEGLGIGLVGAVPGALLGLAAAAVLTGGIGAALVLAAGLAVTVGVSVAALASVVPVLLLRRLPTALLLTEE
jgi:ABC-type antimicrobial peptide transport system permease subunit